MNPVEPQQQFFGPARRDRRYTSVEWVVPWTVSGNLSKD